MAENYNIEASDIEAGKAMGGVAYIGLIGFLIAFITSKDNRYVMFHAQQGLALAIGWLVSAFMIPFGAIPVLGWLLTMMMVTLNIGLLVLFIIGLINGFNGTAKPLPVIGTHAFKLGLFKADETPSPPAGPEAE